MTYINIRKHGELRARITLPASKSICNRALIINALSAGDGQARELQNISDCDDSRVVVAALSEMPDTVDIGAAGTAMRFLSAYLCVTPGTRVITGTERMRHRPIGILVDALRQLGAKVEYAGEEGFPPLRITGDKYRGGELQLPGNVSSQYISALLMIGPVMEQGLHLHLTGNIVSRPYINMTLTVMRQFGAQAEWDSESSIMVHPVPYRPVPYMVENDWSASSYWYQMVALSDDAQARIELPGLFAHSTQGDSEVARIFQPLGVKTEYHDDSVIISKDGAPVQHLEYDFVNQPDLAQTLVATCCAMGVTFRFSGLQSLKIKETDRIAALRTELKKLGFVIGEQDDSVLFWNGERCEAETLPAIDTYEDHRMAMALAPCCMRMGGMRINNPEVVSKSYPGYWDDLTKANFEIQWCK